MVYPPGGCYTPEDTPEPEARQPRKRGDWEDYVSREQEEYDFGIIKSESQYQYGPDTYLLQLRDVGFPTRLREYMKVACDRSPVFVQGLSEVYDASVRSIHLFNCKIN